MPDAPTNTAWTRYWQGGALNSCIAGADPADAEEMAAFWATWADSLPADATVLDLATGNGAVPAMLLARRPDLVITGVDHAAIDPDSHAGAPAALGSVRFHGGIDLAHWVSGQVSPGTGLPLADQPATFAAITSQFGIEYAGLAALAPILAAGLADGGQTQCLLHHQDSAVVAAGRHDQEELAGLLGGQGIGPALAGLAGTGEGAATLEQATHQFLAGRHRRTRRLTGATAARIDRLLDKLEQTGDRAAARADAEDLWQRLLQEQERLGQLAAAALSDADAAQLVRSVEQTLPGATVTMAPLTIGADRGAPALLGWHLKVLT